MDKLYKAFMLTAACFILLSISGCFSGHGLDGEIITLKDGRIFELQHFLGTAYVLHRLKNMEVSEVKEAESP